jgi:hypothetical protein
MQFLKKKMEKDDSKQESYDAKKDVDGLDTGLGFSGQNWDKKRTPAAAF